MLRQKLKTLANYLLILALGLAAGYIVSRIPAWLQPSYTQGDYKAYYPDTHTRVAIYGTSWCQYCAKTRAYLRENHIAFADYDIETSPKARQEYARLGGGAVPVVLIGDRRITGFNQSAFDSALQKIKG